MEMYWNDDIAAVRAHIGWNNVDVPDSFGTRPLEVACLKAYPNFDVVSHLLGFGASVEFSLKSGEAFVDALRRLASENPYQQDALQLVENVVFKNHLTRTLNK